MLVKCPSCGKPISDIAEMCPHCKKSFPNANRNNYTELSQIEKNKLLQEFKKEKPEFIEDERSLLKGNKAVKFYTIFLLVFTSLATIVITLNIRGIITFSILGGILAYFIISATFCFTFVKLVGYNAKQKSLSKKMVQYEYEYRDWLETKGYNAK